MNPEEIIKDSFFHIRLDSKGNIYEYEPNQILSSKGGYTFGYFHNAGKLTWGIAKCHERDNYNRRLGRNKSRGRAYSKQFSFDTKFMDGKECKEFAYRTAKLLKNSFSSQIEISEVTDNIVHVE